METQSGKLSQTTENKTQDDDYDDDIVESSQPLGPFEDIENDPVADARFVASSSKSSIAERFFGRHHFLDKSLKLDDDKGDRGHDDRLNPFREFIKTIEDAKDGNNAIEANALSTDAPSLTSFLEDVAESTKDEKTYRTKEEGAKRSVDTHPETCKKRCMQERDAGTGIKQSGPIICFLCKKPVEDFGLLMKACRDTPVVLKLRCSHLVHTVCMSYLYYVRRLQCPICRTLVLPSSESVFHMTNYLRWSTMIQTKLLEFMETELFRNGEKKLINWLYKKVNGQVDIDFVKEKDAEKWPVLKSNEFVHEVLRNRRGFNNHFLKDLAEYCVVNHSCDEWCPIKCWYRNNISDKGEYEHKVRMEYKNLKHKNGDKEYETSTDDSDYEEYDGPASFPCPVPTVC